MAASQGQGEENTAQGIVSGHAYSLISINEFEHQGQLVRLLKLRNPWGSGEWKGDWSDASPLWTPELRASQGCKIEDDGTFFIPFEQYLIEYAWTSVAIDMDKSYKRSNFMHKFAEK